MVYTIKILPHVAFFITGTAFLLLESFPNVGLLILSGIPSSEFLCYFFYCWNPAINVFMTGISFFSYIYAIHFVARISLLGVPANFFYR